MNYDKKHEANPKYHQMLAETRAIKALFNCQNTVYLTSRVLQSNSWQKSKQSKRLNTKRSKF